MSETIESTIVNFSDKESVKATYAAAQNEIERLRGWIDGGSISVEVSDEFHYRIKHLKQVVESLSYLALWID